MTVRPITGARRRALFPLAALTVTGAIGVAGTLAAAGPADASTKATTVTATETDFHIALSKKTFSPGKYTFVAKNKGQTTHALQITGPGLSNTTTKDISPGQSAKLTVTFKKGAYDVFCPVPGHKMLGMNVNLRVGGSSTTAANTSTPATTPTTSSNSSAGSGGAAF